MNTYMILLGWYTLKKPFFSFFYSMSSRVMHHFERSVSFTHTTLKKKIEKKIKKRKNLTSQHFKPGRVGTVVSVLPGSRVQQGRACFFW